MTTPAAPPKKKLTSLLLALCCRAAAAGGIAIPPAAAAAAEAVAEKIVDTAVAELTVRVPELAKVADTVEHVAAEVVEKIQDLSGAVPAALAPILEAVEEVAEKVEEVAQQVEAATKPGADPALATPGPREQAPLATEQRAPSPVPELKPEEPTPQVAESKPEAQ
jgi:hypothetical protein